LEVVMQIRDQWKYPRNWKVVTGAGALAAVGLAGFALSGPNAASAEDDGIELQERAQVAPTTIRAPLPTNGVVDLSDIDDNDSPFDDNGGRGVGAEDGDAGTDDSPRRQAGSDGNDSVDTSPDSPDQVSPATVDLDSPDQDSPATPDQDSPDVDSPDSPDVDSPDVDSPDDSESS
jgi:hypothetical protein